MTDGGLDDAHLATIAQNVATMRSKGATDEEVEHYVRDIEGVQPQPQGHDYHAEYASGALQKRMQGANAREQENVQDEAPHGIARAQQAVAPALARVANLTQGIPGVEAAQAIARASVNNQPYADALGDIRGQTARIPKVERNIERIVGALPAMAMLPGGPVGGGALWGAAEGALDADPNLSLGQRAFNGGVGAAAGATLGKVVPAAVAGVRARLGPNTATLMNTMADQRGKIAKILFPRAEAEGVGKTAADPDIQRVLARPDIRRIADHLLSLRQHEGKVATDPTVLTAVNRSLTDAERAAEKGLAPVDPTNLNTKTENLTHYGLAKQELQSAMHPTMPSFGVANRTFARQSGEIDAVRQGHNALKQSFGESLKSAEQLMAHSPETLEQTYAAEPDAVKAIAGRGVMGGVRTAQELGIRKGARAAMKAPGVLRSLGDPTGKLTDQLVKLGLVPVAATAQSDPEAP